MCTVNYYPYIRETLLACTSELPKERFNAAKALVKEESYILGTGGVVSEVTSNIK